MPSYINNANLTPYREYYNLFSLPPAWTLEESPERAYWRLLIIGFGAGTAVRVLEGTLPEGVRLVSKAGGRSGDWQRPGEPDPPDPRGAGPGGR